MEIYKVFRFEAAHYLPNVPEGHKCKNVHGHSYKVTVFLKGPVGMDTGWVLDFGELTERVEPLIKLLDHQVLNSVIENPTAENLAIWLWENIKLSILSKIIVEETESCGVIYQGKTPWGEH